MKVLGSLKQVFNDPSVYKTAADAKVVKVKSRSGRIHYKYASRRKAALSRFDKKIKSGKYKGMTFRQMFKKTRNTPFKKGEKRSKSFNCKKKRERGMLSRSPSLLIKAYRQRKITPVHAFGVKSKGCSKSRSKSRSRSRSRSRSKSRTKKVKSRSKSHSHSHSHSSGKKRKRGKKSRGKKKKTPSGGKKSHSGSASNIWQYFKKVKTIGKTCSDGKEKYLIECLHCGKQMRYCSRDGPGNHYLHLKTKSCALPKNFGKSKSKSRSKSKSKSKSPIPKKKGKKKGRKAKKSKASS